MKGSHLTPDIDLENAIVGSSCTLERWKVGVFSVPTSEDLKSIKNSSGGDLPGILPLVPFLKLPIGNRIAKCAQGCRAPARACPPVPVTYLANSVTLDLLSSRSLLAPLGSENSHCFKCLFTKMAVSMVSASGILPTWYKHVYTMYEQCM